MIASILKKIPQFIVAMIIAVPGIKPIVRYIVRTMDLPLRITQHLPVFGRFRSTIAGKEITYSSSYFDGVARVLYWKGAEHYESETALILQKLLKHSSIFFDIGANVGFFTMFAKAVNPKIEVHSFEPVPSVFSKLLFHVKQNFPGSSITCNQVAIGDHSGMVRFNIPYFTMASASFDPERSILPGRVSDVRATTLDEYVQSAGVASIDVMKIDVEGFEPKVLQGGEQSIRAFKPIIILECLPECDTKFLEEFFSRNGYLFYHLTSDGLVPKNTIIPDTSHEFQNYLFVPKEKTSLIL